MTSTIFAARQTCGGDGTIPPMYPFTHANVLVYAASYNRVFAHTLIGWGKGESG